MPLALMIGAVLHILCGSIGEANEEPDCYQSGASHDDATYSRRWPKMHKDVSATEPASDHMLVGIALALGVLCWPVFVEDILLLVLWVIARRCSA